MGPVYANEKEAMGSVVLAFYHNIKTLDVKSQPQGPQVNPRKFQKQTDIKGYKQNSDVGSCAGIIWSSSILLPFSLAGSV